MASQSPPQFDSDNDADRQLIVERVLKRVRLSKAKRTLQTRLGLASFKASRGWQDISFEEIEPHLLGPAPGPAAPTASPFARGPTNRGRARSGVERQPMATTTTPERRRQPSHRSDSARTRTELRTPDFPARPVNQARAHTAHHPAANHPHTPEQLIRSKWTATHPIAPNGRPHCHSQGQQHQQQHEIADQTTAAELMLFLATGSPSPDHRVLSRGN